jgi:hypothetical protein
LRLAGSASARLWHDDRDARVAALFLRRFSPPIVVALFIVVFLDAQDAASQLSQGLARAAEQALGPGATVVVRPIPPDADERALVDAARAQNATALARVTWSDAQRLQGTLDLRVLADDRRFSEALLFQATDPLLERGRALGLVIAAWLTPAGASNKGVRGPPSAETPARSRVASEPPVAAAVVGAPAPTSPALGTWFLDAAAAGGIAFGGAGSGLGGTIGLGRSFGARFGWRIGARARFGEVAEAEANDLSAGLSAGLSVAARRVAAGERFGVDLRLDALLLYEALSHLSADDAERVRRGRLVPGAALVAEGRYHLGPGAAMVLGAGPEVIFGRTDVVVHEAKVAELVPLRVSVHAGLRITF